ncbi:amino acid ABC transporter permease (plasmid) [Paroceanicella profunda]|uniref:Amino acid ABC transporter permease n=1 Tax=Paroceanicella profunda TaxID=2579971 RepID=A0A5B8G2Z6_9RHOB|nr:amino acid ABC transporter permease [Paroceanicella profunda]QDL94474.1 amino acid ABC transporter permease [Paroceanicella profunda]
MAATTSFALTGGATAPRPAPQAAGRAGPLLRRLFRSPLSGAFTLALGLALIALLWPLFRWAILDAVWYAPDPAACRAADAGACWAVIAEKHRVILFGAFPYQQQWRGAVVVALWLGWALLTAPRWLPLGLRLGGWLAVFLVSLVLMRGGLLGLSAVGTDLWGGLPLTFMIFGGTVAGGLPLAVALALGRRSDWPVISFLCAAFVECVRGFPLLVVLFFAALILPLFLPPELDIDKLLRAEIGMIVFFAAYAAEAVRGGLQALPEGQEEAAKALGMRYTLRLRKVVLPQAIAVALPALFNDIIRAFKNTTFFSILGLFDVLGATKAALQDPDWVRYGMEGYLFVFLLYFLICTGLSLYGRSIERDNLRRLRRAGA